MKKIIKNLLTFSLILMVCFSLTSCKKNNTDGDKNQSAETIELSKVMLSDVEFENSKQTEIDREGNIYTISGTIDAMSKSQKIAYGDDSVTHVVALKFSFDKERTISSFEIKGETTRVYSDTKSQENYVGSMSELLDSEDGEDAFANLILSAKTETYRLTSTYTDGTTSSIELKIVATLATATAE